MAKAGTLSGQSFTPVEAEAVRVPRVTLQMFADTNAYRTDGRGDVREAHELMGAFVYNQTRLGRLADTEENFRALWMEFCQS